VSIEDPLILMPDTIFTSFADLPEPVREQLGEQFGQRSGYVLTQPHDRKSSTLVDEETAELLRAFTTPSTIVDVVIRYSRSRDLDAERVLEDSFPALRRCLDGGYLVRPGSERARRLTTTFAVGDRVARAVVVRCVQSLADSEIYQLALDSGGLAALKVLHSSRSAAVDAAFRRETAVLRHLDGADAPRLLGSGSVAGGAWMLLEWCEGVPAGAAAAMLRRSPDGEPGLLALGRRIAQAYARLHANGVVHGDVHPGNLIVSPDGDVRIVDFGLARGPGLAVPPRGGAPRYVAPDQARAMLAGTAPGPATESSDQYCLAVVLYEVFTGHGYLGFALDRDEMLRQIAEDPPLPFTRVGLPSWPEVEEPLRAALAKDPGDRLASVAELDQRLAAAGRSTPVRPARPGTMSGTVAGVGPLLDAVLADARPGGRWFTGGLPTAPLISVAYGTAGLAVALHHVATFRDDPELAALADEWALRAAAEAIRDAVFEHPSYELTEAVTGRVTPFHRRSGIHAVQALVSHSLANGEARRAALDGYVAESRQPCENLDLVLGRSGTLLGAAILHEAIGGAGGAGPAGPAGPVDDLAGLVALGNETMRDIWAELDTLPPIADGTQQRRLGVAHGWAGFLLATLRWCGVAGVPRPAAVGERLAQLAGLARPEGVALRWPWTNDGASSMPGWCNGSAGLVHLWTAAHAAFRDQQWADLAERAAWDAYLTPAIGQLCCGLAGQAYALLELYRYAGERRWLTAATELATRAAASVTSSGTTGADGTAGLRSGGTPGAGGYIPGSLHKGELGIAILAADLTRPEIASMPFFGSMR
jgi:eukaryotic-like serine/threonine-protein kinase